MYDVRDLLESIPKDLESPEVGVVPASAGAEVEGVRSKFDPRGLDRPSPSASAGEAANEEADRAAAAATLERVIRAYMTPPIAEPVESIQFTRNGTLVANLLPDQQTWLDTFLTTQRVFNGGVGVSAELYMTPHDHLRSLGVGSRSVLPTPESREAFVTDLKSDSKTSSVVMAALQAAINQRVNLSRLKQVSYVEDWTIQIVEPNDQEIADPQIGVIREGFVLELRATPTSHEEFGLDLKLTNSVLQRPIRTAKTRISTSSPREVEIGLPELNTIRIATTLRVADGASAVLSSPIQGDMDLVLVLTVRREGWKVLPLKGR